MIKKIAAALITIGFIAAFIAVLWLLGQLGFDSTDNPNVTSASDVQQEVVPADERTVLIYMCGSNLETTFGAATKNIAEMLTQALPDGVNVVIETGGSRKWRDYDIASDKLSRYRIKGGELELLQTVPQDNMGYKKTFSDFLNYGMAAFPAENTAVILWDHGGGCIGGLISDENYHSGSLSIDEASEALSEAAEQNNCHVDLVGMDACLMGNFETAYALKDCCDHLLASEEIEPTGGWDYSALINTLVENKSASGDDLGRAICDGFNAKYADPSQSPATLSLIDLSKIDAVGEALDASLNKISKPSLNIASIRNIADSAFHSARCGGNSENAGYSNLIDLDDFADYYGKLTDDAMLDAAIKDCVEYLVNNQSADFGGLSFYYPVNYKDPSFTKYYEEICPLESYKTYLKEMFLNIPETTIEIEKVEITDKGALSVTVTEESLPYLLSKEYSLAEIIESGELGTMRVLGIDNDIESSEDGRMFISNFRGVWPALNGCTLNMLPIGKTESSNIYEAPVRVNGEDCFLRFAFVFDETVFNNGYYKVLGVWDGMQDGMAEGLKPLDPDDEVEVCSMYLDLLGETDDTEEDIYDDVLRPVKVPKSEDGYLITEEPLKEPSYLYGFTLIDIYGNEINDMPSALMQMTKTPEELKENPLPDGTYAAEATLLD